MRVDDIVLEFDPPDEPMSMNDNPWKQRKLTRPWRDTAYYMWCQAHPGKGPKDRVAVSPAEVFTIIPFDVHRTRDPINYARTVKAIVDGLVRAGAWPDDTIEFVTQHVPVLHVAKGAKVVVRVTARYD